MLAPSHRRRLLPLVFAGALEETNRQRDALIVRSTIDLAHSLGLKVTAEGIEKPDAFQVLAAMGCDSIQGYLIAKPQPLDDLLRFMGDEPARQRSYG